MKERNSNMKVILVNGSPHKKGSTFESLSVIEKELQKNNISTYIFQLGTTAIGDCLGCGGCKSSGECVIKNDPVNEFISLIKQGVDGLIFATPVYYAHASGRLLSFMDRVFYSAGTLLRYKPVSSVAVSRRAGSTSSIDDINKYFLLNRMPIVSSCYWNEVHGTSPDQIYQDEEGICILKNLATNMAWLLQCIDVALKNGINLFDEPKLYYLKEKMNIYIFIDNTLFKIEKNSHTPGLSKNNLNNIPNQIISRNNINPNILNMNNSKPNSNNNINNIKVHILNCLILLYANKKEIFRIISNNLPEKYDLQNYTLVNKTWIDTFKNNFDYKNIKEILLQQNIGTYTYDDFKKNLQYYHSILQISNIISLFNGIPNDLSQTIKLLPGKKVHSKFSDIIYPSNFELVNVSLFNLLKTFIHNKNDINNYQLEY